MAFAGILEFTSRGIFVVNLIQNRWLRRALIACVLIALGFGVYHFEPPAPTCEIESGRRQMLLAFAFGESAIATCVEGEAGLDARHIPTVGPLVVWDTRTGAELARHFGTDESLISPVTCQNGRRFAAEIWAKPEGNAVAMHLVRSIDLVDHTAVDFPLDDDVGGALSLTPAGDMLTRLIDCTEGKELQIYESATGQLLAKHISKQLSLFDATDRALLFATGAEEIGSMDLEIWSVPERRQLATIPDVRVAAVGPDGHLVLLERLSAKGDRTGTWAIWNVDTLRTEAEFFAQGDGAINARPLFSPDGRWLAMLTVEPGPTGLMDCFVELREVPTGRSIAKLPGSFGKIHFSPDGRWLAVQGRQEGTPVQVAEIPGLEVRWSHTDRADLWEFSADSHSLFTFIHSRDCAEIVAWASDSGTVRARTPLVRGNLCWQRTLDKRAFLIHERNGERKQNWLSDIPWLGGLLPKATDSVVVIDTNGGGERFRLTGAETRSAQLSNDGKTLVTQHGDGLLRCWDVDVWKPLHWPIGVPAGIGALALAFGWWRRRAKAGAACPT